MNPENDLLDQAVMVSPLGARQYAETRGWEFLREGLNSRVYLFRHPIDRLRQLLIPMDGGDRDYGAAILDAARRLSELEKRPIEAILSDLIMPGADVLRIRVMSLESKSGFLSLEGSISLLEGAKRAILSSACSVEHPTRHHPRMAFDEAKQMVQACRIGHTERGSYIVKIACPLDAVDGPFLAGTQQPFVRRATGLMMSSAKRLVEAIEEDQVEKIYQEPEGFGMLSSNFCDALLRMQAVEEKASLNISASWASILPLPDTSVPKEVTFNTDYFPIIEQIRERLRSPGELKEALFVGTVEQLSGVVGADNRRSGEITLSIIHDDEKVTARTSLEADDYSTADKAHMSAAPVAVQGILHLGKRIHKIAEPKNFRLLES